MKISMFTEVFLPKIDGVVTRVTRHLDQLAELGHEVQLFAPGNPPKTYAGFDVQRVRGFSFKPVYPEITVGLPTPAIAERMKEFQPDIVHAVNPVALAAYGVLSARRRDIPLLASFHTNVPEYTESLKIGWLRQPAAWWIRTLHNEAEINLVTSGPMLDKARDSGMRNIKLWPKAVDTVGYTPDRYSHEMRDRMSGGHPEAPLVVYVGRMSLEKDLDRLAGIMTQLREIIPDARLAMVGSGPQIDELKNMMDPAWTTFTGYMSGAELAQAFASGDVFAFPSTTETLGLVALESFASGVPVVGARAGGIPFVIDEGETGFLVDPQAPDSVWAECLAQVLNDDGLRRLGANARAEAERWSWRASTEKVVEYYQEAIDLHARRLVKKRR
ncbi:glycosyltransferase family 4 protein [Corynebacterium cystitidis]|uniref:Glycosyltransferase involved in cell wall bisynthesis n=1 Tax=Corynebacterium cystitidis DSM 20524 TaxID=1121357 RepID=A0A1H9TSX3_9CORY|nr:glycosyltransferase family 1 protein [Corynebacterium cystitidis]WJY81967.1 GDP-mannose-dependent alpha-mannosyltransferase [Corynebacterium cystitidis DSM 20524]SES00152.1 Glycosyltransferase involved in cell wall bisynthesis [Corynebacterium cystitidis DSM 20524]SNV81457.1 glycogen synthase [Corynebacterium cystitidis]